MRKGPAGTSSLNQQVQSLLNPPAASKAELPRRPLAAQENQPIIFRDGDRVIQARFGLTTACGATCVCVSSVVQL